MPLTRYSAKLFINRRTGNNICRFFRKAGRKIKLFLGSLLHPQSLLGKVNLTFFGKGSRERHQGERADDVETGRENVLNKGKSPVSRSKRALESIGAEKSKGHIETKARIAGKLEKSPIRSKSSGAHHNESDWIGRRQVMLHQIFSWSEIFGLERKTCYLAINYLNRLLATNRDNPGDWSTLSIITCLYMASKLEEVRPMTISYSAKIGNLTVQDMRKMESIVLKALRYNLSAKTSISWLTKYMQNEAEASSRPDGYIHSESRNWLYMQAAQILDLATLDCRSTKFPDKYLAASAIYHVLGQECAMELGKCTLEELSPCVRFLSAFAATVFEDDSLLDLRPILPTPKRTSLELKDTTDPVFTVGKRCFYQTAIVDLKMLEKAQARNTELEGDGTIPSYYACPSGSVD